MNDTQPLAPTDAELDELRQANGGKLNFVTFSEFRTIARAALAKWGTPPAAAGEPAAYLHDDGYWTAAKTDVGRSLNDRLLFAGSPKVAVYTAPQPTQAQAVPASAAEFAIRALVAAGHVTQERVDQAMALPGAPAQVGAVPLTDREIELIDGMIQVQLDHASRCDAIANRSMADKQKGWDMERVTLLQKFKAHGIKGGQHGTE